MLLLKLVPVSPTIKDLTCEISLFSPKEVEVVINTVSYSADGSVFSTVRASSFTIASDIFFTALRMGSLWREGVEATTRVDCEKHFVDFSIKGGSTGIVFRIVEITEKKVTRNINFFIDHPIGRIEGRDDAIIINLLEQWNNFTVDTQWRRNRDFI